MLDRFFSLIFLQMEQEQAKESRPPPLTHFHEEEKKKLSPST